MRRYLILFLLLILLIPCIAVPASASAWTDSDIENVQESLEMIENDIYTWFVQWYDYFFEATETVNDVSGAQALVTPFKYDLIEVQMYVWSWIGSVFDDIKTDVSRLESYVYQIYQYTLRIPDILGSGFSTVSDWFSNVVDKILRVNDNVSNVFSSLESLRASLSSWFNSLIHGDSSLPDGFEEDMVPIETQVDEWLDVLETSPTIPEEDFEQVFNKLHSVGSNSDPYYLSFLSTVLRAHGDFLTIYIYCFIFAIVGFILYGKR